MYAENASAFMCHFSWTVAQYFDTLLQLSNTKSADNKSNLMHYLVDIVQKKYTDLINFDEELIHVEQAARGKCKVKDV